MLGNIPRVRRSVSGGFVDETAVNTTVDTIPLASTPRSYKVESANVSYGESVVSPFPRDGDVTAEGERGPSSDREKAAGRSPLRDDNDGSTRNTGAAVVNTPPLAKVFCLNLHCPIPPFCLSLTPKPPSLSLSCSRLLSNL